MEGDRHRGGYCGNCLRFYTRKENWNKHFESKHVQGAEGIAGRSVNICYQLDSRYRIWDINKEKAKNTLQLAKRSEKYFKRVHSEKAEPNTSKKLKQSDEEKNGHVHNSDVSDDEVEPNRDIVDKHSNETKEVAQANLDEVLNMLQIIQTTQVNHTNMLKAIDAKGASSSKTDVDDDSSIKPDQHFVEAMLSLKHATDMSAIMNNKLIKDDFKIRLKEPDENQNENQYEIYCLGCSDRSLRGIQGKKQRATSFTVKDPEYSKSPKMPQWFINLKQCLRRHLQTINHHQLSASYHLLQTKSYQTTSTIKRLRLNLMYFIMKTNSPFTLYPVLLAVLSRCGQEVGNKNSSRFVVPKVLNVLGM